MCDRGVGEERPTTKGSRTSLTLTRPLTWAGKPRKGAGCPRRSSSPCVERTAWASPPSAIGRSAGRPGVIARTLCERVLYAERHIEDAFAACRRRDHVTGRRPLRLRGPLSGRGSYRRGGSAFGCRPRFARPSTGRPERGSRTPTAPGRRPLDDPRLAGRLVVEKGTSTMEPPSVEPRLQWPGPVKQPQQSSEAADRATDRRGRSRAGIRRYLHCPRPAGRWHRHRWGYRP